MQCNYNEVTDNSIVYILCVFIHYKTIKVLKVSNSEFVDYKFMGLMGKLCFHYKKVHHSNSSRWMSQPLSLLEYIHLHLS